MRIGFEKKIELEWVNLIAFKYIEEKEHKLVKEYMNEQIEYKIKGNESRRKVINVLDRIWIRVDKDHENLRNRALGMLPMANSNERLLLHWGMAMLAYPFFVDIASNIGRLLNIQDEFSVEQIYNRILEKYGAKGNLKYAVQRAIRSFYLWGTLEEVGKNGVYRAIESKILIDNAELKAWFVEVCIRANNKESLTFDMLYGMPSIYPFDVNFNCNEIVKSDYLSVNRLGIDIDVIELKKVI